MSYGYSELDLCSMCCQVALVSHQDENERTYVHCRHCGYDSRAERVPIKVIDNEPKPWENDENEAGYWQGDQFIPW